MGGQRRKWVTARVHGRDIQAGDIFHHEKKEWKINTVYGGDCYLDLVTSEGRWFHVKPTFEYTITRFAGQIKEATRHD